MSDFAKCPTCREYGWLNSHRCAPIWEARIHETRWEEDWTEVRAHDGEEAAAKFAEQYDQDGEYSIVSSCGAEIQVRKQGEDTVQLMDVQAETVPQYRAWERKPAEPSEVARADGASHD